MNDRDIVNAAKRFGEPVRPIPIESITINGVRGGVVARIVDRIARGVVVHDEFDPTRTEIAIAHTIARLRSKMQSKGYAKPQILASMRAKMIAEAQRLTGQRRGPDAA